MAASATGKLLDIADLNDARHLREPHDGRDYQKYGWGSVSKRDHALVRGRFRAALFATNEQC
jgi:hypothetical protein